MHKEEILNIDYNVKILVLKALNKFKKREIVAEKLGITRRHLYNYIKNYSLYRNKGVWLEKNL